MVFYFTGTGNSLYAAKCLDDDAVSIPQVMNSNDLSFEAERIGIVCPLYGHEMPAIVKEFIRRAAFHTEYLYVVLTYGARHGNAVELADEVFRPVGKKADYITTLLMTDNFLPSFDMAEEVKEDKQTDKNLSEIRSDIFKKKCQKQKVSSEDRAIHRMYTEAVGNAPETVWADFTVTDDCVGCGICTKVCPVGSILLENQQAVHTDKNCQACYACIHACPKSAIKLNMPEKNPLARYRNEHVSLCEIVKANNQTDN